MKYIHNVMTETLRMLGKSNRSELIHFRNISEHFILLIRQIICLQGDINLAVFTQHGYRHGSCCYTHSLAIRSLTQCTERIVMVTQCTSEGEARARVDGLCESVLGHSESCRDRGRLQVRYTDKEEKTTIE